MEPSTVAAAYTAETAIEGIAAGALAIAQSTVPLKARFYRLPSPSPNLKRSSHSLSVVKGRVYIFGGDGDVVGKNGDNAVHMVTLPNDLALRDTDYQKIPAVGATSKAAVDQEGKSETEMPENREGDGNVPVARAGHCASVVGDRIYIFGGSRPTGTSDANAPPNPPLEEDGKVYAFNTIRKTWEVLIPSKEACSHGVPQPRNYASTSSTTHPLPIRNEGGPKKAKDELMTEEAKLRLVSRQQGETLTATDDQDDKGYGTLFLHSGYDSGWNLLRDCWTFEIASRVWSRWPDVPESDVEVGEGNICCVESRLWRLGDAFGKVVHLDILRNEFDDMGGKGELGISPKTGDWEVHAFGVKQGDEALEKRVEEKMGGHPTNAESLFPPRRKRAGFVPVTTGQGRDYLLLFLGETGPQALLDDVWTFQIPSEHKSAAAFKDQVRKMVGRGTGLQQWAKADILKSNQEDGELDIPKGLSRFGSSSGGDFGGVVIWGGIEPGGKTSDDGWIIILE